MRWWLSFIQTLVIFGLIVQNNQVRKQSEDWRDLAVKATEELKRCVDARKALPVEPPDPKKTVVMFALHGGIFFMPRLPGDPPIIYVPDYAALRKEQLRWAINPDGGHVPVSFTPHREFRRVYAFCDELPFYMEQ